MMGRNSSVLRRLAHGLAEYASLFRPTRFASARAEREFVHRGGPDVPRTPDTFVL
jgi:hypothetical protein